VTAKRFTATVTAAPRGTVLIPVPFDPDAVWGKKNRHLVGGTVDGRRVRGSVDAIGDGYGLLLGPMWARDCGVEVGSTVAVVLEPEGPQRDDLSPDLAAALAESPAAGAFFDSLAQFYRKAYVRWIEATKRRPDLRAERIAEVIRLLSAGQKERPR
jgi:hypothetical protein